MNKNTGFLLLVAGVVAAIVMSNKKAAASTTIPGKVVVPIAPKQGGAAD